MPDKPNRVDRVEIQGGIIHLPAEFREVALLANAAGLEGWKLVDAEYGLDAETARKVMYSTEPDFGELKARVQLTYTQTPASAFLRDGLAGVQDVGTPTPTEDKASTPSQVKEGFEPPPLPKDAHKFVPFPGSRFCGECMGGELHPIHITESTL